MLITRIPTWLNPTWLKRRNRPFFNQERSFEGSYTNGSKF